jgi:alkanesulfonate monooxygenase SsuD/methylene tetrahydromethanopterin reductase-like flavin-dependent oxidoreductase (luciferase family)
MQFGIGLPNLSYIDPTETLIRLAHAAQELAFDAIWVSDIVLGIRGRDSETMIATARRFVEEVRPNV